MNRLIIITMFIAGFSCFAQTPFEKDHSMYHDFSKKFNIVLYTIPLNKSDSVNNVVFYKVPYSALTFDKIIKNTNAYFVAVSHIEIELRDENGIIKKYINQIDTITTDDYDKTKMKSNFLGGIIKFKMLNDNYSVSAELNQGSKVMINKAKMPPVKKIDLKKNQASKPILVNKEVNSSKWLYKPFTLDSSVSFSAPYPKVIMLLYNNFTVDYSYTLTYLNNEKRETIWSANINLDGVAKTQPIENCDFKVQNNNVEMEIVPKNNFEPESNLSLPKTGVASELSLSLLEIPLPVDKIIPGKYQLLIKSQNGEIDINEQFKVIWEDMPISLHYPEYAADLMSYILTDEELENVKDGSRSKVFQNIVDYWKKSDPTPFSTYNEAMTEYFKRADYAHFNFQTFTEKDGAKTDRGKIYMLYGKPNSVEQVITDSKNQEVWRYHNIKKEFIFEAKSSGVFALIKIVEL